MRLDTAFRLSFYITLGLACACLAQAEAFFHVWFPFVCLPLAGTVFMLAWRHEGRWIIHETASNYLGIFITLATGGWILLQVPRSDADLLAGGVPWPAGLLPHLGLLLLVLLAVKLFRPKMLADFWVIQTMGMMIVTLGCVLAGDLLFAVLMVLYVASLVWCLALFQLYRGQRSAETGALFSPPEAASPAVLPWRRLGITRALRWSLPIVAAGLTLFLLMPRSGNQQWVPQKLASAAPAAISVGLDSGINLNQVGTVELSSDPAFHVSVSDRDGKPASVSMNQLWRVEVLDYYERGHWMSYAQVRARDVPQEGEPDAGSQPIEPRMPPRRDRDQRVLHFQVQANKAGGLVLAEPVDLRYAGLEAMAGKNPPGLPLFWALPGGDASKSYLPTRRAVYHYAQVLTGADAMERLPARFYEPSYGDYIVSQAVPEAIAAWARDQLAELPQLTPAQRRLDAEGRLQPQHHAAVSTAFCRYFAFSGDYTYSLRLMRQSRQLDATADFLLNVKSGHCERFAAALALTLRSLGVPARVVKGYRGAEEEEPGKYVVRLDQAHSWVQVLVREGDGWVWLTLDPTPGGADASNPLVSWFGWMGAVDPDYLWRRFVLNYNGDLQTVVLQHFWHSAAGRQLFWQVPAVGAAAALAFIGWRRRGRLRFIGRRQPRVASAPAFYRRLLRVLARRFDLRPAIGQTPLEFALCAAAVLDREPATRAWAALPVEAARTLYRVRFAADRISPSDEAMFTAQARGLDMAAKRRGKRAT